MNNRVHPNFKVQVFLPKLIGELSITFGTGFRVPLFVFLWDDDIDILELLLGGVLVILLLALRFLIFGTTNANLEVTFVIGRPRELLVRDRQILIFNLQVDYELLFMEDWVHHMLLAACILRFA